MENLCFFIRDGGKSKWVLFSSLEFLSKVSSSLIVLLKYQVVSEEILNYKEIGKYIISFLLLKHFQTYEILTSCPSV